MAEQSIRITQGEHWAIIILNNNKTTSGDGRFVTGTWRHTNRSYTGDPIQFTSDHPDDLTWEWRGDARGGVVQIGSRMARASHKANEKSEFWPYIVLNFAKVTAGNRIAVTGGFKSAGGRLNQGHNPHFEKGEIEWSIEEEA